MLRLADRDLFSVTELAQSLDKNVATIYRWGSPRGVRGHRLRLTRIGGRTYVERADWEAFCRAINGDGNHVPEPTRDRRARNRSDVLVDSELDAAGF
jgi:hypothetical protein